MAPLGSRAVTQRQAWVWLIENSAPHWLAVPPLQAVSRKQVRQLAATPHAGAVLAVVQYGPEQLRVRSMQLPRLVQPEVARGGYSCTAAPVQS